ncbi:hypothetical protein FQN57_001108 [Myotisia sp. PD_48]|nr:hypothetical protein FQN57_001108 [Myotisia sp. PD_48]
MCKRSYAILKRACRHHLETPGNLVPDNGCNACGIDKGRTDNIASTTSHIPCDDCEALGIWAKTADGKWYEVATGGPKEFNPFTFPLASQNNNPPT